MSEKTAYRCNNCGCQFETPMKGIGHLSSFAFCPYCQDSDYEKMTECEVCGEFFVKDEDAKLYRVCPECEKKFVAEHRFNVQAIYEIEEENENVKINNFLAWAFKPEEIEEILLFALKEKQINQPEDYSEYLYGDYDWLEEKIKEVMKSE